MHKYILILVRVWPTNHVLSAEQVNFVSSIETERQKLLYFTGDSPSMPKEVIRHPKNSCGPWQMTISILETDSESAMGDALLFYG